MPSGSASVLHSTYNADVEPTAEAELTLFRIASQLNYITDLKFNPQKDGVPFFSSLQLLTDRLPHVIAKPKTCGRRSVSNWREEKKGTASFCTMPEAIAPRPSV